MITTLGFARGADRVPAGFGREDHVKDRRRVGVGEPGRARSSISTSEPSPDLTVMIIRVPASASILAGFSPPRVTV